MQNDYYDYSQCQGKYTTYKFVRRLDNDGRPDLQADEDRIDSNTGPVSRQKYINYVFLTNIDVN